MRKNINVPARTPRNPVVQALSRLARTARRPKPGGDTGYQCAE